MPLWRTPSLAAWGRRGENEPADKPESKDAVCYTIQRSISVFILPLYSPHFPLMEMPEQVDGECEEFCSQALMNREYLCLCTQRHSPTQADTCTPGQWTRMTLRHFIVTLGKLSANTNSQMFAVSLNKCNNPHWKHGSSVPLWVWCTHWSDAIVGHFLWSLSHCWTCNIKEIIPCLFLTVLLVQLDRLKTKGHFTHKNISMLHD